MQAKLLTLCAALCAVCLSATSQNLPDYVPSEGLVGWYPFNGNANDESGNGNDGAANGAVLSTDRWGHTNRSYSFSGSGDYVVAPRLYQNAFSVSLWFKTESVQGYNPLIDAFDSNWEIQLKNSRPDYVSFNDGGGYIEHLASNTVQNNVWYNLVCTFSDETVSFYTDGTLIDQFSVFVLPNNSGDYFIGASPSGTPQFFIGTIDDVGIWDRALTEEEILALYNAQLPVPGCTDESACNFNAEANNADNSCIYPLFGEDCETGAAACGEGTEWDVTVQACVVSDFCQEDLDGDGAIGVTDLMQLLSLFGTDCPIWMCGDPVNYDGYDYATVKIGNQCWFAENLRTELYQNGDAIQGNLDDIAWAATTEGAQAVFGEGESECIVGGGYSDPNQYLFDVCDETIALEEFGRVYNSYAISDSRGVCPIGWHVAANAAWNELEGHLDSEGYAGSESEVLKSVSGWPENASGTDVFGFTAVPGGQRTDAGFQYAGGFGRIFSSTDSYISAYRDFMGNGSMPTYVASSTAGLSVRCLKDTE